MRAPENLTARDYLSAFMNLYWLRPESAVWRTLDCLALKEIPFTKPILDIGCGDGLFSFSRAGGLLDPSYDMFSQVGELDAFYDNVDIYDHVDPDNPMPAITSEPAYQIDVGLDHKESLLKKAQATGLYNNVKITDVNIGLPVEDGRFRTVFSNIVYWLADYRTTLSEIRRVLSDDGIAILHLPSDTFRNYSFYQRYHIRTNDPSWAWLELLDRGRSGNIKLCKSYGEWRDEFSAVGLKITHHRRYLSKIFLQAWDIGLRPISPYLIDMANKLGERDRAEIKNNWITGITPLIEPLCKLETPMDRDHLPGFHLFVLEKQI